MSETAPFQKPQDWFITKWWASRGILVFRTKIERGDRPMPCIWNVKAGVFHVIGKEAFTTLDEARADVVRRSEKDEKRLSRLANDRKRARELLLAGKWPEVERIE